VTVQILPFDPATATDGEIAAWVDVQNAAQAVDRPDEPPLLTDRLRDHYAAPKPEHTEHRWTAHLDGRVVATLDVYLYVDENDQLAGIEPVVLPAYRRRGIGTALAEHAIAFSAAHGRRTVVGEVAEGTAAVPFAETLGFAHALTERSSVQRFAEVDWDRLNTVAETPHPPYRLVRAHGKLPDELVAPYAAAKVAMNDAPIGDLDWNDAAYSPRVIDQMFASTRGSGGPLYVVCAVLDTPDGPEVAGLTEIQVRPWQPTRAEQWDTCVVPAHRGHGLGVWIKAELTRWVRDEHPEVVDVETWNAEANSHMLAVNTAIGYRPDRAWYEYQRAIQGAAMQADLPAGLATSVTAGTE
jgi:GNAT superfamily N-acetyltransferase